MKYRWLGLLLLFTSLAAAAEDRPRIGLVLGGGGARGAAHIGVLKELERQRVPIDAIAGTSMGAIIGGLYASGMSVEEIEQLLLTLDWIETLSDDSPRKALSFRRKQDDTQYPFDFELGLQDGEIRLPMGIVQGQKLDLVLRKQTVGVSHIESFDDLPIPFRAVATDLVRGEPYVMVSGDLVKAIRASMSVPGILAPIRVDDRLLVDGGILENLPIDAIRGMDVDVIIAVDVEFPLYDEEELDSVMTVAEQILTIPIRKETLRQLATLGDQDVVIKPALGTGFGSADFGRVREALEPGTVAARNMSDKLRALAVDERDYAAWQAGRKEVPAAGESLAFVRVAHDGRLRQGLLESRLETQAGDAIDPEALERDAKRLYGLDLFGQVSYDLLSENGGTGVEFQARPKSQGPNTMRFSLFLENDFEGSTTFNVATRLTKTAINDRGAEWRTDFQLGTDPLLVSEFYQPFGAESRMFFAPRVDLRQSVRKSFVEDDAIARYRVNEVSAGIDFGMEIAEWGELRLGAFHGVGNARVKVGDTAIPNIDFNTGGVFAQLQADTLDHAHFPGSGYRAGLTWTQSLTELGADQRFESFESEYVKAWSRGRNNLQLGLGYATTFNADTPVTEHFTLGGFLRMSGLEQGEISGPHAALGKLVYYRRIGSPPDGLLNMPVYLGASFEAGNVWQSRSDISFDSLWANGSVFAGLDTYIGPVFLGAGVAEGGEANVYLFIGSSPR
ncbi:MAG: BamA/TamA family outer membrane protein [Woeseiaceae bacterium]|nr:BamA/TamA family outer membrane protein [Woeseiaceae bacterium]